MLVPAHASIKFDCPGTTPQFKKLYAELEIK